MKLDPTTIQNCWGYSLYIDPALLMELLNNIINPRNASFDAALMKNRPRFTPGPILIQNKKSPGAE